MTRVLFLEDEEDLVLYLPRVLKEDLEIVGTTSIDEALRRFAEEDFDAVLLDIVMPPADDMDAEQLNYGRVTGVEIARRMKDIKPNVPIVAFTVVTDPEIRAEMWKAGIDQIISKPSEPDQIAYGLWRVIRAKA
jgi:CheY-like chemotaxis protein